MPTYFYHILLELPVAGGGDNRYSNNYTTTTSTTTPTPADDEHVPVTIQRDNRNSSSHTSTSPSSSSPPSRPHSRSHSQSQSQFAQSRRRLLDRLDNGSDVTLQAFCDALQPFRNNSNKRRTRGAAGKASRGGDSWNSHHSHLKRKDGRRNNCNGDSSGGGKIYRDLVVLGGGGDSCGIDLNGLRQCRASLGNLSTSTPTTANIPTTTPTATAPSVQRETAGVHQQQQLHESPAYIASTTSTTTTTSSSRLANDKRLDQISIESIDMVVPQQNENQKQSQQPPTATSQQPQQAQQQPPSKGSNSNNNNNQIAKGIGTSVIGGLATKGKYVPLDQKVSDSAWGIVHLYRDAEETSALYRDDDDPSFLKGSALTRSAMLDGNSSNNLGRRYGSADVESGGGSGSLTAATATATVGVNSAEDCTTLCILAVPSYMSPSDFLGFVGEQTRDEVSHFRMIRTARANRYMVLMKFRSGKRAKEWQRDWNGKVFNSMEPETCHVVFVKTVEIQVEAPGTESKFPDMNNDPFTPATTNHALISSTSTAAQSGTLSSTSLSTKPLAPPTPSLIELPTCPVCLERMDETTGLLTIICQHVFHCTCLQKWKGSGCPVCRYTQDEFGKRAAQTFDFDQGPTECQVCHSEVNLWLCLICGNIGCGRYDEAHAFAHFKETSHAFAMDLASQRVWDYVGDGYVHRIIQNKSDGKLVELPAAGESALDPPDWADAVPREKLENMSVEYTHLLTSQLESQRTYFEEVVERAADKASVASAAATAAQEAAETATKHLSALQAQYDTLLKETIPNLERDKGRAERRAEKFETMAHRLEKEWREEKALNGSLMEKVEFLNGEVQKLTAANEDLKEQNRDLSFFISGAERLRDQGEDVVEGTVSVPEPEEGGGAGKRRKGKGKGRR
ncbi:BRCA1-associated protein [Blastomyces parvus]|uniref:BRCA1-associated protein n=1 Tax=Blastomyces parvus TaxID=2060905 RepID=A0A2B7WYF2_9EURO|nr:BRCA1-associated protein [Blastomyces parvus]